MGLSFRYPPTARMYMYGIELETLDQVSHSMLCEVEKCYLQPLLCPFETLGGAVKP